MSLRADCADCFGFAFESKLVSYGRHIRDELFISLMIFSNSESASSEIQQRSVE